MTAPAQIATRAGRVLHVRPATPSDASAIAAFFDRVTDEDRRFRFFAAGAHVNHAQIAPLVEADHYRSESFLATDPRDGSIVASGLLACDAAMAVAEVAVSVRGDRRNQGIGWAMLKLLAEAAQARGVQRVLAIEARENHAAIAIEREQGFAAESFPGDPAIVVLSRNFT